MQVTRTGRPGGETGRPFRMTLERFTRWQAAPIHLCISAVIAALVVFAMLVLWYPQPYFRASGGQSLLLLLIGVDVVIGPLLTLIVFDPRKKRLKLDLAVIAILQLAALAYGTSVMFDARPVYVTFAGDRFELVEASAIDAAQLADAKPEFRRLPLTGPRVVGASLPVDPEERVRLGVAAMMGVSVGVFPQYYVPYAAVSQAAIARSRPLARLREWHPDRAGDIDAWVAASGRPEDSLRFVPLQARHGDMSVIVDARTGDVQGVLAIYPWE
jgi:hypothetical protein